MDLCTVKHSFSELIKVMNPWTQSHFVMWLDIKVAEYKVYGKMVLDNKSVTTPEWLRNKNLGMNFDTEMTSGPASKSQISNTVEVKATDPREQHRHNTAPQHGKDTQLTHNKNIPSRFDSSANDIDRSRREANVVDLSNYSDCQTHISRTSSLDGSYNPRQTVSSLDKPSQGLLSSGRSLSAGRPLDESRGSLDQQHVPHSDFTRSSDHNVSETKFQSVSYNQERSSTTSQKSHSDHHSDVGLQSNNSQELSDRNASTFINPYTNSNQNLSDNDVTSNFTKLATTKQYGTDIHSKTQFQHPNISSDVDIPIKIEILDEDSEDSGPAGSHTYKKSLPDFGRTFATSSRHTSSTTVPTNQQITSPNILGSDILSQGQGQLPSLMTFGDYQNAISQPVPVSMYMTSSPSAEPQVSMVTASDDNTQESSEHEAESTENTEQSWKHKKWQYIESLRGSSDNLNPKVQSRIMQRTKVFPDPFPVERLKYGNKARDMINSGVITRPAKMQFLDTVFNEIVKYTGLYPTPTQKMEVAKAIVNSFPKLNVRSKDSHISPADSWFVVLNDKFRNERRGLNNQSYQTQHMRQRALLTVRRAQAHMYNMVSMSRSPAGGTSGVIKSQPDEEENGDT